MVFKSTFQERCVATEPPPELSFFTVGIEVPLILTNIPGNLLIILAVVCDPNKNLRAPFNWLFVNLAIADLLVGIFEPFLLYLHIKEGLKKEIIREESNANRILYFTSCTSSVLSLLSLAVERYLTISKPIVYRSKVTNKRIFLTIGGIWLISLSLPNIYWKIGFINYAFIFASIIIKASVIIIFFTYSLMKKFKNAAPFVVKNGTISFNSAGIENIPYQNESLPTLNANSSLANTITKRRQLLEAKVTEMFLVVASALFCCYCSSTIMIYLVHFCNVCSCITLHWFRDLHVLFALMNSSVNFFCYALRSSRFRSSFVKLLRITQYNNDNSSSNIPITKTFAAEGSDKDPRARSDPVQKDPALERDETTTF